MVEKWRRGREVDRRSANRFWMVGCRVLADALQRVQVSARDFVGAPTIPLKLAAQPGRSLRNKSVFMASADTC
jgi:hypothetical protein